MTNRLLIFTNKDLESIYTLNLILPHIAQYTTNILISDKVGKPNRNPPAALKELKFLEQSIPFDLIFPLLDSQKRKHKTNPEITYGFGLVTSDFGPQNLDFGLRTSFLTLQELSKHYSIPIESFNDVKAASSLEYIRSLQPDLVLSIRYGKIFGNEFVGIPPLGIINLHSGLLPHYRGVLATFRAMMNQEKEIGCTLHFIENAGIDTGGIIGFVKIPVTPEKSLLSHILSLYPASRELIVSTIEKLFCGEQIPRMVQEESTAAYFTFPTEPEIQAFSQQGWKFSDPDEYISFIQQFL